MRKVGVLFVVMVVVFGLLVSCGNGGGEEAAAAEEAGDETGTEDVSGMKLGVSMYTLGAPYFAAQEQTAEKVAEELGMDYASTNAQGDMNKQLSDVEDLLAQGIDLLILNPLDPQGLIPATMSAKEAGVPVVIMDSSIDESAYYVTTVQSNNLRNGELVGEEIADQMSGTPIRMALISGAKGNPVGKERRQGVFRGIIEQQLRSEGSAGFDIVTQGWGNWAHEGGLDAMEDILTAFPDINVLLTENDSMALGALEAIEATGKSHANSEAGESDNILVVAAADGQKEALALIQEGEYFATGMNDPALVARTAVEVGVDYLQGERGFPNKTYTPAVAITAENVDEYYNPDAIF